MTACTWSSMAVCILRPLVRTFAVVHRQQQEYAVVEFAVTDGPGVEQVGREDFQGAVAGAEATERGNGDYNGFDAGLSIEPVQPIRDLVRSASLRTPAKSLM